jgi:hypothetical protein
VASVVKELAVQSFHCYAAHELTSPGWIWVVHGIWYVQGAGETQPYVWATLRTNYGSGLNVFLGTSPKGGVPAKMANRLVGGQRVGWRSRTYQAG